MSIVQSGYETLLIENYDGIRRVTLNRPERLNAINGKMHSELERIFREARLDGETKALILTGAGRAFTSGGDADAMVAGDYDPFASNVFLHARSLVLDLLEIEVPVVAAVNGVAVGLGATMALLCDAVVIARSARIGDPHVRFGLVAGDGGSAIWPLLVGPLRAKRHLMTGDLLSADEAERLGLVTCVVDDSDVLSEADRYVRGLLEMPPLAVRWTRFSINRVIRHQMNLALDTSLALEAITLLSRDHAEAIAAFREKRKPNYIGR